MKKIVQKMVTVLIVLSMGVGLLAGCGSSADDKGNTLYIYNWSEYIPQSVYEQFEEETGIHVVESTFSSNEEMLAKLVAGGTGEYDLIVASNYVIPAMVEQGLIQELNGSKLANFENLTKTSVGMSFDPENKYSVPYMATITLLAKNTEKCKELNVEVNGLQDLTNPALQNNLVLPDDCREVVDVALKVIGEDPDSKDEATVEKASDWLSQIAPNVKLYDSDTPYTAFATNEVAAGLAYNMDVAKAIASNENIEIVDIPEGNEIAYDNFVLTSKSKNAENAKKFIEFILRPEVYKVCLEEYPCVCLNEKALALMGDDFLNNPASNVSEAILSKAHVTGDVGEAAVYYDNVFSKMKN